VRIEALDGSVRQLAESVIAVDQKVDRLENKMDRQLDDMRSLVPLSHRQLEQRVTTLEDRCEQSDARLTALEAG
jgi:predicted  nucleic acid-binding Zn-ribbon protein